MDYKSLKYYVTVVESGTISAAAKKLYMSQPPLSNQMYKLEEELGCRLFERTTKRIVPENYCMTGQNSSFRILTF